MRNTKTYSWIAHHPATSKQSSSQTKRTHKTYSWVARRPATGKQRTKKGQKRRNPQRITWLRITQYKKFQKETEKREVKSTVIKKRKHKTYSWTARHRATSRSIPERANAFDVDSATMSFAWSPPENTPKWCGVSLNEWEAVRNVTRYGAHTHWH